MRFKLLTEHHLEILSFKGGCTGSSESTPVGNATSMEITCRGSIFKMIKATAGSKIAENLCNQTIGNGCVIPYISYTVFTCNNIFTVIYLLLWKTV